MLIFIGVLLLVLGLNMVLAAWFHLSTRRKRLAKEAEPVPAKLIDKQSAWADPPRTGYDYERTSIMGEPVPALEPGDSDPPEPYT